MRVQVHLEKSWAADGRPRGGETDFADAKGERHVVTVRNIAKTNAPHLLFNIEIKSLAPD